jgi:spore maturation protein B
MKVLLFLSQAIVPVLIFYIIGTALLGRQNVYDDFLTGAKKGIRTVVEIMPTLIGLMVAVGVLRASGFLDMLTVLLGKWLSFGNFPTELLPLVITKMFSSSAATGLLLDIYKEYGTDSYLGLAASLLLSSTETIFYTMSVYFMSVRIKKTRYTLAGALFSSIVGIAASIWIARYLS